MSITRRAAAAYLGTLAVHAKAQTSVIVSPDARPTGVPTITWYTYDLPPISILSGPDASHGINNQVNQRLQAALPGMQHIAKVAGFNRIYENLRVGAEQAVCVGLQKKPRGERELAYSLPFTIALAQGAVVLKAQAGKLRALLDADGMLPLAKVLADGSAKVGIAAGRSYLASLNAVLAKHQGSASVTVRNGTDMTAGLLAMLQAGRFDFTLMYAEEAQYFARKLKGKVALVTFALREAPGAAPVHVAVPKNAWGDKLLADTINPQILKFRDTADYHRQREYWMDDETRKRYRVLVRGIMAQS